MRHSGSTGCRAGDRRWCNPHGKTAPSCCGSDRLLRLGCSGAAVAGLALSDGPRQAGAVSALVGLCADGTPWPMGWVIALCGAGGLLCARLLVGADAPWVNGAAD